MIGSRIKWVDQKKFHPPIHLPLFVCFSNLYYTQLMIDFFLSIRHLQSHQFYYLVFIDYTHLDLKKQSLYSSKTQARNKKGLTYKLGRNRARNMKSILHKRKPSKLNNLSYIHEEKRNQ